jgi:hypothetical protein
MGYNHFKEGMNMSRIQRRIKRSSDIDKNMKDYLDRKISAKKYSKMTRKEIDIIIRSSTSLSERKAIG